MNPSNRTIEEKLAIVQQLRSNANTHSQSKPIDKSFKTSEYSTSLQSGQAQLQEEENSSFFAFLILRIVICLILFGLIIYAEIKNPTFKSYINTMISTEESGNLIDFMSPFTYTLQETE